MDFTKKQYEKVSKIVRKSCGCSGKSYPIEINEGGNPPDLLGNRWHYKTKGGRKIYHPSAYSKKGWGNMRYVSSTIRIEVGTEWVMEHCFGVPPSGTPATADDLSVCL